MSSSTTKKMVQILRGRMEWKRIPDLIHDRDENLWSDSHFADVVGHVLEVNLNSDVYAPITTILWGYEYLFPRFEPENYSQLIASFTQELQELFMVPKLRELSSDTLKKNEVVAAFIDFLVQLLSHGKCLTFSFEDRINNVNKELRSLVIVLGDNSLLGGVEIEHVGSFLAEFEAVANEAGILVYSLFFAGEDISRTGKLVGALLKQIELLKTNIIRFSNIQPSMNMFIKTPEVDDLELDSFSILLLDSVVRDLEELMSREDDDLIVHVKGQIKLLHKGLTLSQSFLKDLRMLPRLEELKQVVMRIRDVAYEAEYLINSFLVRDAPLWYLIIRIPTVIHKNKLIGIGIQEIKKTYYEINGAANEDFRSLEAKRNNNSDDVEDIVVGLEEKIIDILDLLIGGEGKKHLKIITIVGMPGLGKTTLAKKLYNHSLVNYSFDKLSMCIVSQAYQMKSVLTDILISIESELDRAIILNMEEESLRDCMYQSLSGRRYLIVMDDIWNSNVWDDLRRFFPDDGNGSRILFTSRNKDVAPPNSIIHELSTLSNEQCWELLQKKVFGSNESCPPQLLDIGDQIAASCGGLPLAVVVVAGILSTMDRETSTWENVGKSLASYILAQENNSTKQILELSYKHLPDHLKPCFLYFGAFPEHKKIPVRKLKSLWIAEGFICKEERKSLESVAEEYLMELIGKSLVIVSGRRSDGGVKNCVIHDLLHDLCLRRAEEEHFLKLVDNNYSIYGTHPRLCAPFNNVSMNPICKASHLLLGRYVRHVRSFLGYPPGSDSPLNLHNMELLRVLDCWNKYSADLRTLVHLRYLAINHIRTSVASLVNLEFLLVHNKVFITPSLLNMAKLRYLQANEAIFLEGYDSSTQVISNLEYLSDVRIFTIKDVEMLKCSPHLRKLKCKCRPLFITEWKLFSSFPSKRYPDLRFLTQLESLRMTIESGIAAEMNFPPNIKKLTLTGLCTFWEEMSIIGTLPSLKVLKLESCDFGETLWETRDGEFKQLRFLKLKNLSFIHWNVQSSEHFPELYQLVLHDCNYLEEIPCEIGEIPTLQMIEVKSCNESVAKSAVQIQNEQREMGNELRVVIL